jgi:hypothetical protein
MAADYQVRSVIVCDDVRREGNGKELLIGVYPSAITLPAIPTVMPALCVRMEVVAKKLRYKIASCAIFGPDKKQIVKIDGPDPVFVNTDFPAALGFQFTNFPASLAGEYEIHFGMDKALELISNFWINAAPTAP